MNKIKRVISCKIESSVETNARKKGVSVQIVVKNGRNKAVVGSNSMGIFKVLLMSKNAVVKSTVQFRTMP